jgi:biopolymer transport protein ExbD
MQISHAEPNLIPLLDLVLQLVMFFMATTNFARENNPEAIKLPLAQSAKPIEDDELKNERLFLNVEENGDMRVRSIMDSIGTQWFVEGRINGKTPLQKKDEGASELLIRRSNLDFYFNKVHDILADKVARDLRWPPYKKLTGSDKEKVDKEVADKTIVVLRAHQMADYGDVYDILTRCQKVGFSRMQVRATMDTK